MDRDEQYHRERAKQCRDMADHSDDSRIRRLHEELAELHARQAQSDSKQPVAD